MNLTLSYVRERLLNAGSRLQQLIVQLDPGLEPYNLVHDAQNQLALGLAALVQIEHDNDTVTFPIVKSSPEDQSDETVLVEITNTQMLVRALRAEAERKQHMYNDPERASRFFYTQHERNQFTRVLSIIESLHPSLLGE